MNKLLILLVLAVCMLSFIFTGCLVQQRKPYESYRLEQGGKRANKIHRLERRERRINRRLRRSHANYRYDYNQPLARY